MATIHLHVSDELLADLQHTAAAEGKTIEALAGSALRKAFEDRKWQELLEYGRESGQASGYSEEDKPRIVKEWRREKRGQ